MLENKNKRLVDNEDLHSDLLSITAHELRTPLQTISGYVEKIMEDARYREFDQLNGGYLSVIQKNTARLQSKIEKIINISKIENNSTVPTRVAGEFNQVKDLV